MTDSMSLLTTGISISLAVNMTNASIIEKYNVMNEMLIEKNGLNVFISLHPPFPEMCMFVSSIVPAVEPKEYTYKEWFPGY